MDIKAQIMDESAMMRSLARITHEIIEKNRGCENIVLVGVKRRGVPLAQILAANLKKFEGADVPVGYVDISLYRDDLTEITELPRSSGCFFPVDVKGKTVIIVDDVIYTGRTARAALEAVFANGRPRCVQLAVLVDRGHRELPLRPDYVGKNVPTSKEEVIKVEVESVDGRNGVSLGNT
ncbi:MAG: bifunctional pyr operon transcriptional regulator/uracil phosphoribosyltransferase PyrR [Clostridia bacterium]|nr:bifunctional pyr operon transcriptional regulator/uracil phosphoribosyltransferase PyrR [Clostridia bacterium]